MSRILYFDAFSGVSGDMTVGAMLALGLPFELLREELAKVETGGGFELAQTMRDVNGIRAVKFDVALHEHHEHHHHHGADAAHDHAHGGGAPHPHRHFADIRSSIERSGLAPAVRETAIAIFARLAVAEGRIHGVRPEDVAFHEVGAIDSIVDIVGSAIGLHHFGVDEVYCSPLPLGSGFVECQHGVMPVPAPATIELLRGLEARPGGEGELVTPTGAAIVSTLVRQGAALPAGLRIDKVGYGAGTRMLADRPNVLRLVLGDADRPSVAGELVVLEANIDDSNPEIYEHVVELLFAAGARDVWLQPVVMKKGRPAVVLSVLGDAGLREVLAGIVLRETSSIGVRHYFVERYEAPRSEKIVATEFGDVAVKVARAPDGTLNIAPEFEACRKIARERGVPLKEVYAAAIAAARRGSSGGE